PAMEVDSPASPPPVVEPNPGTAPSNHNNGAPPHTATAPHEPRSASAPAMFCIMCGVKVAATEESCPNCGCPIHAPHEDDFGARRRPRARDLPPVRGFLAIIPAVLIPVG